MEIIKPLITQIDRAETLRYAGLSRDKTWQPELLDKACMQLLSTAEPQFVYRIATHHEQVIDGKYCYSSQALQRHLRQSKQVVLLAGTLGQAVDELGDRPRASSRIGGRGFADELGEILASAVEHRGDLQRAVALKPFGQ